MLTGQILKEALSKLTDEELARPLIIDVHSFMSLKGLKRDDLLGNMELAQSSLLVIPSMLDLGSKPENRTVTMSLYPKGEQSPSFLVTRGDQPAMDAYREFFNSLPDQNKPKPTALDEFMRKGNKKKSEKGKKPKRKR